jgi:hypothetical protein
MVNGTELAILFLFLLLVWALPRALDVEALRGIVKIRKDVATIRRYIEEERRFD